MPAFLEAREVWKIYQQGAISVAAVRSLSMSVSRGEVVLILGPSGSGKTTLLSILGCILRPSSGEVWVNGTVVSHLPEIGLPVIRRTYFGFVFQAFHLFPFLTAVENVEVAMELRAIPRRVRKVKALELLTRCRLDKRAKFYPSDLSGGEQQRIAFARALAGDPEIMLADEPTANLDSSMGEEIFGILRQFAKEGKVVVIVSHDSKAHRFADRVLIMRDGSITA
jgi:putative ABC transport system ATP-binding protein